MKRWKRSRPTSSLALPSPTTVLFAVGQCAVEEVQEVVARVGGVDPKAHFESVDVDHRHGVVADLNDITDRQLEFAKLLWQLVPPCKRRNRWPRQNFRKIV